MSVKSMVAVMIAVSGLWLAARFRAFENVVSVNAAAPNSYSIAAIIANRPSFSPLRNDICDDVIGESLSSIGIKQKRIPSAGMRGKCGDWQAPDWADLGE